MRDVNSRAFDGHPHFCGLNDGVLFGVHGITDLVTRARRNVELFTQTFAFFLAGYQTARSAVVSGGKYALVFDDDGSDLTVLLIAAGPARDESSHFHKSDVPFVHIR